MADSQVSLTISVDTTEAMQKLEALRQKVESIPALPGELLEVKPDRWPWVFASLGWIAAVLIAIIQP